VAARLCLSHVRIIASRVVWGSPNSSRHPVRTGRRAVSSPEATLAPLVSFRTARGCFLSTAFPSGVRASCNAEIAMAQDESTCTQPPPCASFLVALRPCSTPYHHLIHLRR
jgi:hypothetical protein